MVNGLNTQERIENIENGNWEKDEFHKVPNGEKVIFNKEVEVVFPVLHGQFGEDGTIQGLCKLLSIPCVGPGVMSSALVWIKIYTKYILEHAGIKQANYVVVTSYDYETSKDEYVKKIEGKIRISCIC